MATKRTRALYKAKGYSDDWIEKRMRSIAIRDELTEEWKKRGVKEQREYAILTAEISQAAFGLTPAEPAEYARHKKLDSQNLRDHMTDLKLIFSMLGEASTTEIARSRDTQGFHENKHAARQIKAQISCPKKTQTPLKTHLPHNPRRIPHFAFRINPNHFRNESSLAEVRPKSV